MAAAAQHTLVLGIERIDMPGAAESLGSALGVGKSAYSGTAVFDAHTRAATFELVDSHGKGSSEHRRVLLNLMRKLEFAATRYCKRHAEHATRVFKHEVYLLGSDFLGSDNDIAFILAVFVIYHYHHLALAEVADGIFDIIEIYFLFHIHFSFQSPKYGL